ncbi:MAG TPA: gephyrin-like molybdotransferase Glp [Thermoanaerobaculia bacterium]|nr:gephyrin-like molybdotransferase Glp [Thermoanaerobaculia bacterium]
MLPPAEAWRRIEPHARALAPEISRRAAAAGRVLADDLRALADVPGGDVSAMDGYALGSDVAANDILPVSGMIAAGAAPGASLSPGSAVRIMTGAPVPAGADRVVPVEHTDGGAERVALRAPVEAGANIRRQGEVMRHGAPLLPAGTLLTPGALALLATHGYGEVPVVGAPRVAILTTGDEVVAPEATPAPGQLRDSHTDFLTAACWSIGARPHSLGIAPDDAGVLRRKLAEGLSSDVVIVSGGVSMGELDLVEGVLAELGCEPLFDAIAIQPGKPMVAAVHAGGLLFALPGNPASAMVCFWLLVRPALRRLSGLPDAYWREALRGTLTAPLPAARDRDRFLPARVRFTGGEARVEPLIPLGSHDLAAYARGTALVRAPAGSPERRAGEACEILPLVNWANAEI